MKLKNALSIKGNVRMEFTNIYTGDVTVIENHNLVTTAGLTSIAEKLRGLSNRGEITYCALGTDATAPDVADIVLGNEIERKLISVRSNADNVATFQTFFTTAEGNGVLTEAGLFGDGATAIADTGTLFCHTAISKTKTSSETLSVVWTVTIGA